MKDKPNYCSYVEKGIRVKLFDTPSGLSAYVVPCCHITNMYIPSNFNKAYKVSTAEDVMNNETLLFFKNYFNNHDNMPEACIACINQEDKGLQSPRQRVNRKNYDQYDISTIDVVLGNSCNLACPFCSSHASSLIDKLSRKLNASARPESWYPLTNYNARGSAQTTDVVADILSKYKVHTLKLIGGEPFLKENWDKIATVIDSGVCNDMHLEVTTNGTILNDDIFKKLSKTKSAHLRISVDSIDDNYEFIRWPHNWNKMHKNLKYLRENNFDNIHVSVSNLVNIFNFEFLPEIEAYFSDVKNVVGYSTEIKPITHLMNYQNLPEHIINNVRKNIKRESLKQAITKGNNNYSKEVIKREFDVLLAQRKMKAENVIGPMTREWLGL